jgi:hypothetical protein
MDRRIRLMVVTVMLFIGMIVVIAFGSTAVNQINKNTRQATIELNQ